MHCSVRPCKTLFQHAPNFFFVTPITSASDSSGPRIFGGYGIRGPQITWLHHTYIPPCRACALALGHTYLPSSMPSASATSRSTPCHVTSDTYLDLDLDMMSPGYNLKSKCLRQPLLKDSCSRTGKTRRWELQCPLD